VTVPVKAFTANASGSEIHLNQLHKDCNNRIRYQKTCPEHGEVSGADIVSGYEYGKGQYVRIDLDELSKLRTESDRGVHIHGFIDPGSLDAMYMAGRTYYLTPDGAVGQKPYALLRKAMVDDNVHALAQVVLSGREQLVLLRPFQNMLVMSVLLHDAKVKKTEEFQDEIGEQALSAGELELTKTLLAASKIKDFDFTEYRDDYVEKLTKLIQAKVDGEEIVEVPNPEEPKILNLMEALKRSVAAAQLGGDGGAPATDKKLAPSAKKRGTAKKKSG
jgi:DNA end-binding protein Ku